jgi:hypothetical protein
MLIEWLDDPVALARAATAARVRFLARFESATVAAALADFLSTEGAAA